MVPVLPHTVTVPSVFKRLFKFVDLGKYRCQTSRYVGGIFCRLYIRSSTRPSGMCVHHLVLTSVMTGSASTAARHQISIYSHCSKLEGSSLSYNYQADRTMNGLCGHREDCVSDFVDPTYRILESAVPISKIANTVNGFNCTHGGKAPHGAWITICRAMLPCYGDKGLIPAWP